MARRGRILTYLAAAVIAVGGGYGAAVMLKPETKTAGGPAPSQAAAKAEPWYQSQQPPAAFLTPNAREPVRGRPQTPRPYEEKLPAAVYVPPVPPAAPDAKPPGAPPGAGIRPVIAIVIDDAGVDMRRSAQAIALPGPLTISFLTYADDLARQTAAAAAAGHELLVHMSMEPGDRNVDPGPNVLLREQTPAQQMAQLSWGLGRFTGYVGLNNHMGSSFTADRDAMRRVLEELKRRGLLFLDSRTSTRTVGALVAREVGLAFAERNVFLDHEPVIEVVKRQLAELEKVARRRGYAVAIGHPRDATIAVLAEWLPKAAEKGFRLVPISAIVARRRRLETVGRQTAK